MSEGEGRDGDEGAGSSFPFSLLTVGESEEEGEDGEVGGEGGVDGVEEMEREACKEEGVDEGDERGE